MATVKNVSSIPIALTGGKTLEPNAQASGVDAAAENEAAWIAAGCLVVVTAGPPPVEPEYARIPVFGGTGAPGSGPALLVELTDSGEFSDLVVVT